MSCFEGQMREYKKVSIDRFCGKKNLDSTVYFLSHLHEDHTVGLATPAFVERLHSRTDVFVYCSAVTKVLILASEKYRHLAPYIKTLEINEPSQIEIPDPQASKNEVVQVTLLPAFHCPGAVMFLFEGSEGNVLYTGDFRWEHFDIQDMKHLRSGDGVKEIQSIYVDTTFFTEDNLYIPSRQACVEAVYYLAHDWITQSPDHVVHITPRAQFGHEPLLKGVAERLKQKVHVSRHKASVYAQITEFEKVFTADGNQTQIHACGRGKWQPSGGEGLCSRCSVRDKVMVILPTTMWFTQIVNLCLADIVLQKKGFFRACYSFHSSYSEIRDLLSYLKPKRAYANVKTIKDGKLDDTQHRLSTLLRELCPLIVPEGDSVRQLGTLRIKNKRTHSSRDQESLSDSESLDFGSPVKVPRRSLTPPLTPERRKRRKISKQTSQLADDVNIFVSPAKSDISEAQSSYQGSHHSEDEMDLTVPSPEANSQVEKLKPALSSVDMSKTWEGTFMEEITQHSQKESDSQSFCVCVEDDDEQLDETFDDSSQILQGNLLTNGVSDTNSTTNQEVSQTGSGDSNHSEVIYSRSQESKKSDSILENSSAAVVEETSQRKVSETKVICSETKNSDKQNSNQNVDSEESVQNSNTVEVSETENKLQVVDTEEKEHSSLKASSGNKCLDLKGDEKSERQVLNGNIIEIDGKDTTCENVHEKSKQQKKAERGESFDLFDDYEDDDDDDILDDSDDCDDIIEIDSRTGQLNGPVAASKTSGAVKKLNEVSKASGEKKTSEKEEKTANGTNNTDDVIVIDDHDDSEGEESARSFVESNRLSALRQRLETAINTQVSYGLPSAPQPGMQYVMAPDKDGRMVCRAIPVQQQSYMSGIMKQSLAAVSTMVEGSDSSDSEDTLPPEDYSGSETGEELDYMDDDDYDDDGEIVCLDTDSEGEERRRDSVQKSIDKISKRIAKGSGGEPGSQGCSKVGEQGGLPPLQEGKLQQGGAGVIDLTQSEDEDETEKLCVVDKTATEKHENVNQNASLLNRNKSSSVDNTCKDTDSSIQAEQVAVADVNANTSPSKQTEQIAVTVVSANTSPSKQTEVVSTVHTDNSTSSSEKIDSVDKQNENVRVPEVIKQSNENTVGEQTKNTIENESKAESLLTADEKEAETSSVAEICKETEDVAADDKSADKEPGTAAVEDCTELNDDNSTDEVTQNVGTDDKGQDEEEDVDLSEEALLLGESSPTKDMDTSGSKKQNEEKELN